MEGARLGSDFVSDKMAVSLRPAPSTTLRRGGLSDPAPHVWIRATASSRGSLAMSAGAMKPSPSQGNLIPTAA